MPTYDYVCKRCGHAFEHFQSMTDKKLRKCPQCSERALERLIGTGAGVIFKGSGFYETDYKRKAIKADRGKGNPDSDGGSSGESSSTSAAAESKSGSESKTDAKSDGGSDSKSAGSGDANSGKGPQGDKRGGDKSGGDKNSRDKNRGAKNARTTKKEDKRG